MIIEKTNKDESNGAFFKGKIMIKTKTFEKATENINGSIVLSTLGLIESLVKNSNGKGIDYLQAFKCEDVKYWVIEDREAITFLLPSDY